MIRSRILTKEEAMKRYNLITDYQYELYLLLISIPVQHRLKIIDKIVAINIKYDSNTKRNAMGHWVN